MRKTYYLILFVLLTLNVSAQEARNLNVDYVYQVYEKYWCWAATSSSVIEYYGIDVSLCEIVEYARTRNPTFFGPDNCCNTPTASGCLTWNYMSSKDGSIEDILLGENKTWSINTSFSSDELTFAQSQNEIDAGRPFIFRWGWTSGGGHFLVGRGYDAINNSLYYINPADGYHIATYDWIVDNSSSDWTHTLAMTSTPSCINANSVFSDPIDSDVNYEETNRIEINSTIDNNSKVQFKYGNEFIINPGFEIKKGSTISTEPDVTLLCD